MTDKELQRLGRGDLLRLLLEQVVAIERTEAELEASKSRNQELEETYERLRKRLDQKDARIQELQKALQELEPLRERAREADRLETELGDSREKVRELKGGYERLRERLDQKDEKIQALRDALQAERKSGGLDLTKVGSIERAALKFNGVFKNAQKSADQYLSNIRTARPATDQTPFLEADGAAETQAGAGSGKPADGVT